MIYHIKYNNFPLGQISQMLGRKKALILFGVPFTLGWILICASRSFALLIVGRTITGLECKD